MSQTRGLSHIRQRAISGPTTLSSTESNKINDIAIQIERLDSNINAIVTSISGIEVTMAIICQRLGIQTPRAPNVPEATNDRMPPISIPYQVNRFN